MLAPRDITNKQFGKAAFGGYKQEDVNAFLMQIAEEYSRILSEKNDLERQLSRTLEEMSRYQQEQDSLSTVLVGAQKMADTIIRDAKGQSEIIQRDAEIRADKLLEGTLRQLEQEKLEYARVKTEVSNFRSTILNLYKSHLELVNALPTSTDTMASINGASSSNSISPESQLEQETFEGMDSVEENQQQMESTAEREAVKRRKGFVPNLDYRSVEPSAGFSFQQQTFEDAEGQSNEIENNSSGMVAQLSDPLIQADETNMLEVGEMYEEEQGYEVEEKEEKPPSRFGQLQFGQNYKLNREDERRLQKKKKRR